MGARTTRLMHGDVDWTVRGPAAAHEWAVVCPREPYAWGTPPDFRPHPRYTEGLAIVRQAFREIAAIEDHA